MEILLVIGLLTSVPKVEVARPGQAGYRQRCDGQVCGTWQHSTRIPGSRVVQPAEFLNKRLEVYLVVYLGVLGATVVS